MPHTLLSARPSSTARTRFRPRLETLEAREVPAIVTVTNLNDSGPGSLRAEIGLAQNGDTVTFATGLRGTITLTSGELLLNKSVRVLGPGAGVLAVSGNDTVRVLEVAAGAAPTVSSLTFTHGLAQNTRVDVNPGHLPPITYTYTGEGGGVYVNHGASLDLFGCAVIACRAVGSATGINDAVGSGGGISNQGVLALTNCTVADNTATATASGTGSAGSLGGGISNSGPLTVTNSTIAGNSAAAGGSGGGMENGYGIEGAVTVTNSTVAGNSATGFGGGIECSGVMTIGGSTIAGNRGGGLHDFGAIALLRQTIVAGNFQGIGLGRGDITGGVVPGSAFNLVGDGTGLTGLSAGVDGNLVGTAASPIDPRLGPLALNGGPTRTMALLPGSPAINAGGPGTGAGTDQRGYARTAKPALDIGAVGSGLRAGRGVYAVATGPGGRLLNIYAADGTLRSTLTPYPGFTGGVQVAVGDVMGDGRDYVVAVPGPGGSPVVHVYDPYGNLVVEFAAYDLGFTGGAQVALADIQGTGAKSIVTVPDRGGAPEVRAFTGRGTLLYAFNAYDVRFTGGIQLVAADTTGNGYDNLITVPRRGGAPEVRVFDGRNPVITPAGLGEPDRGAFNAYDVRFTGGVSIAAGDTEGQGYANIVTAPGAGGSPEVHVYDGKGLGLIRVFSAYDPRFTGGVQLAVADTLGQGRASILTVPGAGGTAEVRLFDTRSATISVPTNLFPAFEPTYAAGVTLAVRDVGDLGYARIVTARAAGSAANVRVFDTHLRALLQDFVAFDPAFLGGVSLG